MENQVSDEIKAERKERLMELQSQISLEINQSLIGQKIPLRTEEKTKGHQS